MKGIELSRVRTLDSCLEDWADIPRMLTSIGTRDHWATDCGYGLNDIYLDAAGLGNVYGKFINSFHGEARLLSALCQPCSLTTDHSNKGS